MEPVIIAIICTTAFGIASGLVAFIRSLLLSRDKKLNDAAQTRAINQEAEELEKIRIQMASEKRFNLHQQLLDDNKAEIKDVDLKIERLFQKKTDLVYRYSQTILGASKTMLGNNEGAAGKEECDELKKETDKELSFYDREISELQQERAKLRTENSKLQEQILEEEKNRNERLDKLFAHHTDLLGKVYLRHNENSEHITSETINAGTQTYKTLFTAPIQYLISLFSPASAINFLQPANEIASREKVNEAESAINNSTNMDEKMNDNNSSIKKSTLEFSLKM